MSPPCREGIITADNTLEYVNVITSTGNTNACPKPTGMLVAGNHKSHCVAFPGVWTNRSAGSRSAYNGRNSRIRSFRIVIECSHPIRSAITVAGMSEVECNNRRTSGSTASTSDPFRGRSYFGGRSEANAARTVFRASPRVRTISLIGIPSARCNRRISAQSSIVITLQECSEGVSFHPTTRGQYSRVVDNARYTAHTMITVRTTTTTSSVPFPLSMRPAPRLCRQGRMKKP